MNALDILQAVSLAAGAIGVWAAFAQLRYTRQQAVTQFEDGLAREYREIARRLPVKVLLGRRLEPQDLEAAFNDLYNYIDLSNEQAFLRQQGRVREDTWANWQEGIRTNMKRPAFEAAWREIKEKSPQSFSELRRLEADDYRNDPREWARVPRRPKEIEGAGSTGG